MICHDPIGLAKYLAGFASPDCVDLIGQPSVATSVPLATYLRAFAFTCILEAPLYASVIKGSAARRLTGVFGLNLASHPAVYFLFPLVASLLGASYAAMLFAAESFAIVLEAVLLEHSWKASRKTAWAAALGANLLSWGLGAHAGSWLR